MRHIRRIISAFKAHHDFMLDYCYDVFWALFRPSMFFLFFLTMSFTSFFAYLIFIIEGAPVNPNMKTYLDALYFTTSLMTTVGFGDVAPVSQLGRALSIVMMFIGTGLFVSYTAIISSAIIGIEQTKREKFLKSKEMKKDKF